MDGLGNYYPECYKSKAIDKSNFFINNFTENKFMNQQPKEAEVLPRHLSLTKDYMNCMITAEVL